MKVAVLLVLFSLLGVNWAQQPGDLTAEYHPPLPISSCDESGCVTEATAIVIDGDGRFAYSVADGTTPCLGDSGWDPVLCPDGLTCAENCALDGMDQNTYENINGVSTSGDALTLQYLTTHDGGFTIGSRVYLVTEDNKYRMFRLKNRELTFDVDTTTLPCGMNGALYFVEMEEDGGMASYPSNQAGAKYGIGYCDAQCPHYLRYGIGEVNLAAQSDHGLCCIEMDIWEANRWAGTYTTHSCTIEGYYVCEGDDCGDADRYGGVCDKDGCEFGSFRQGQHYYYGANSTYVVDSTQIITVVTQFLTIDGTDEGELSEIRRIYVQNGEVIQNAIVNFPEIPEYDSITNDFCVDYKELFNNVDDFTPKGSLKGIGDAFDRGLVLALSLWEDASGQMLWLDGMAPVDGDPSVPGVWRGPCPADSGIPANMHDQFPDAYITFSNIKVGTINSTYSFL